MWLKFLSAVSLVSAVGAVPVPHHKVPARVSWPNGPFVTSGQYIHDVDGNTVIYAGANWPGHGGVMLPEGLQYQSIETIVSKVKGIGMNVFRLTYAIEMIDQIYENNGEDIDIKTAFINALGETNGTKVLAQVLEKNPQFTEATKRLEVFDAVVAECANQEIYIHLDNHISKAEWCCSGTDGNTWWGDTYFNIDNWVRGLSYMATHGKSWPNLMSMSLRNEPREPTNNATVAATYTWQDWYGFIQKGTNAIHTANADVLIFLSGLNYDTYMTPVVQGTALTPGTGTFSFGDFTGYTNKLVIELHNYENGATSCSSLESDLYNDGIQATHPGASGAVNIFPVVVTEFGFAMDGTTWKGVYATCLASYLPAQKVGWMIWVVVGSYYLREGIQDYDETWGLLTHDWSNWRDPTYINNQGIPMIQASLA